MSTVTAYISTKDRYFSTLPLAIISIANQTVKPDKLVIIDDGEKKDLRGDSLYSNIYSMLQRLEIPWEVLFGAGKGQVANHQLMLELAKTEWIWRVDDDNVAEPNVLETLLKHTDNPLVGAIGSLVWVPTHQLFDSEQSSSMLADISTKPNLQWSKFTGIREVDHLHNTFMFRKAAAAPYPSNLSPVGHREETIFTYQIKRRGFKILIDPSVITWHLRAATGGIRSYTNQQFYEHDENIFINLVKEWAVVQNNDKLVVLDNGLGDHIVFKMLMPEIKAKYGNNLVLAVCYPEVFENDNVKLISLAQAQSIEPSLDKYNIYKFCAKNNWTGTLLDAFRKMYL